MVAWTNLNHGDVRAQIMKRIELRSDTFTLPTDEMIDAIVKAQRNHRFGDDVAGEDEVVNELQEKAARILGKEKALLVTSGTQGNLISMFSQTNRGDEVVMEEMSHSFLFEGGAMASLGGLFPKPVEGVRGYILPETLEHAISSDDPHYARTAMVNIENTHNYAGGVVVTPEKTKALVDVAREHGLKVHIDGARLFNAAVALGIPASNLVKDADSVQICLSKGLSAPVGSLVAGTEEFIHEAHRIRKKMGGGMRQAGIIAAPGIVALEKMVSRLKEDHDNTRILYDRISQIPELGADAPDTNILFVTLDKLGIDAAQFSDELKERGVLVYGEYGTRTRFVLNRMVSREDTLYVADAIEEIVQSLRT
jgi:threonine aldolase